MSKKAFGQLVYGRQQHNAWRAGGGAGFKQGRQLLMDNPKTPLSNLWLSTLRGGIEAETFIIKELTA